MCAHLGIQVFPYSPWIPLRLVCHCFFVCLSWRRQCRVYVYIIPVWHFNTSQQVVVLLFFFSSLSFARVFHSSTHAFPLPHLSFLSTYITRHARAFHVYINQRKHDHRVCSTIEIELVLYIHTTPVYLLLIIINKTNTIWSVHFVLFVFEIIQ